MYLLQENKSVCKVTESLLKIKSSFEIFRSNANNVQYVIIYMYTFYVTKI